MKVLALAIAPLLFCAGIAHAEVSQSAADGFLIVISNPVGATPAKTYAALIQPQHWWNGEHTWSGEAANLSLKPEAGGCFCEHWAEGSAEHGRVVMALPGKLLRLDAALGPLQEFALTGALSFWIKTDEDGATQLNVEYRVNGAGASDLDAFAPKVDEVLSMRLRGSCATSTAAIRNRRHHHRPTRRRTRAPVPRCSANGRGRRRRAEGEAEGRQHRDAETTRTGSTAQAVTAQLLVNIDVDDLARAEVFYRTAFGLSAGRPLRRQRVVELLGMASPIYLLRKATGSAAGDATSQTRDYRRHWTPVHLDFVVDDLDAALARATAAGARLRRGAYGGLGPHRHAGRSVRPRPVAIQFLNRGYDEIATPTG